MRSTLVVGLLLSFVAASTVACSSSDSSSAGVDSAAPADDQAEEEVISGVTKLASKLQDPDSLTAFGDNVYFATTYGYATQEEAQYNHDIWVKSKDGRAKRLYKGLYGATWGMAATKNGIYEINEGYASVVRYPLDGSNKDGESLVHAIYGNEELPEVGIRALAADDDGFVVTIRTDDDGTKPGSIVAYSPAGKNEKRLGSVPGGATALHLEGAKVYFGTAAGDVYVAARDGSGSMSKVASGAGAVASIAVSGDDVFFGTDKGLFAKRKGVAAPVQLLAEGAGDLAVVRDQLVFGQYKKGVSSLPLAGGSPRLVLKTGAPSSILAQPGFLFVTDKSYGRCTQTDEGQACAFDGTAFRVKY
jgi:hypothetical protein